MQAVSCMRATDSTTRTCCGRHHPERLCWAAKYVRGTCQDADTCMGSTGMHDMQSQPPHPRRPCSGTSGMGSAPAAACTGHRWGVRHSSRALSVSYLLLFAAGSLVCTYHKGSQEQAAGVRAGSEKGVAYHIAPCANDGVVFLMANAFA